MGKIILGSIFLVANFYFFIPGIIESSEKLAKLESQIQEYDSKIKAYNQEISSYEDKIDKMKQDFYREKLGRDKHKFIKEGEVIYKPAN